MRDTEHYHWWCTQKENLITKHRRSYTSSYVYLYQHDNIYLHFFWITFRNFELCGVDTAIKKYFFEIAQLLSETALPNGYIYITIRMDISGEIYWMLILNVLIHMTGVAKKQEINWCMCWMTLPEVHPIAHKTSCPEYRYCKCKKFEFIKA